jgi:hypothetical protein
MPGLYGGVNDAVAKTCSGGNYGNGDCWSARMMWREEGLGELYAYFPKLDSNKDILENVQPRTPANDTYGISVGRGSFIWKTGVC